MPRRALKQRSLQLWLTNLLTHAVLNLSLKRVIRSNQRQQKRAAECQRYVAKRIPHANLEQKEKPLSSKTASQLLPVKL